MKVKGLCEIPVDKRPQCQKMIKRYQMCPKMRCSRPSAFNVDGYNFCKLHAGEYVLHDSLRNNGG